MRFSIISRRFPDALSLLAAAGLALAFGARAAQTQNGASHDLEDYLKRVGYLPIALKKGQQDKLLAEGALAGKKRLFVVDTGCGRTALDEGAARGLKSLGELGVTLEDGFLGKSSDPSLVLMDKLTFGSAQFLNQPVRVTKLSMDFTFVGSDGVLGCDFFFRNYCLIDCFGNRLYVRGSKPSEDVTSAMATTLRRSGFSEVPINLKYGLTVDAKVNDENVKLLVDTGSVFSVLDSALAKRLGLTPVRHEEAETGSLIPKEWSAKVVGVGKVGAHKMWVTKLKALEVGPLQWTNVHLGVTDLKDWGLAEPGNESQEVQGLLGRELLKARGALIDYHSRKLWFRPQK